MTDEKKVRRPIERVELDRLCDIQRAIAEIQGHPRFGEGRSAWDEDKYFRGYCERQLAIVGEAATKLANENDYEQKDPETAWPLIKGLRTILVHVYWKTDKDILWKLIEDHLPLLKEKVDRWITEKEHLRQLDQLGQPKKEGKLSRRVRQLTESTSKEDKGTTDSGTRKNLPEPPREKPWDRTDDRR